MKLFGVYVTIKGRPFHYPRTEMWKLRSKRRRALVVELQEVLSELQSFDEK